MAAAVRRKQMRLSLAENKRGLAGRSIFGIAMSTAFADNGAIIYGPRRMRMQRKTEMGILAS